MIRVPTLFSNLVDMTKWRRNYRMNFSASVPDIYGINLNLKNDTENNTKAIYFSFLTEKKSGRFLSVLYVLRFRDVFNLKSIIFYFF